MKLAIMQPYLFPYIGYFQLIAAADKFVVYDDVNFIKQGWINRNRILVNRQSFMFSVPLENQSSFRLIKDTPINRRLYPQWKTNFLKTVTEAYRKAPHFSEVFPMVENIFEESSGSIGDLCRESLETVCGYMEIRTPFVRSSIEFDNTFLSGQDRVIDICRREKAHIYINASGGVELYDQAEFVRNNVELLFIKPVGIAYKQFGENFVSHLSVIDVLMFNQKENARQILRSYEVN